MPTLSIIIPMFNDHKAFLAALESAASDLFSEDEVAHATSQRPKIS